MRIEEPTQPPAGTWQRTSTGRRQLVGFIAVAAIASMAYRLIYLTGVWRTAALFIMLPAGIAIAMVLLRRKPSAGVKGDGVESAIFGVVIFSLIGMVILPEGIVCWIIALPILIIVAALVGLIMNRSNSMQAVVFLPLLMLGGTEGLLMHDVVDPHNVATATVVVDIDEATLRDRLAQPPTFEKQVPLVLQLGFPVPVAATGNGLEPGDQRVIQFTGPNTTGAATPATMTLQITDVGDDHVRFAMAEDTTMIGQWLTMRDALITWTPTADGQLAVTWTTTHTRQMHPGWYFDPLQSYGMNEAADYLLNEIVVGHDD